MTTIDQVIDRLDEIVEKCKRENLRMGYFAILYRHVTREIKNGILAGAFEDNPRMEKLDVLFATRYIEAFEAYSKGLPTTESWQRTFDAAEHSKHLVLQHLFLGINAHINLDLGIAASETVRGESIEHLKNDFDSINITLASLVDGVKANISKISPLFGWLIQLAKGKDEMFLNFSIGIAREGAWKFAGEYHLSKQQAVDIATRDKKIAALADQLTQPGKWLGFILTIIRFFEFRSDTRNMEILEDIVRTK
jgi:hypothetical protein